MNKKCQADLCVCFCHDFEEGDCSKCDPGRAKAERKELVLRYGNVKRKRVVRYKKVKQQSSRPEPILKYKKAERVYVLRHTGPCLFDNKKHKIYARGLCAIHYQFVLRIVQKGYRTWEEFEKVEMCLSVP